MSVVYNEIDEYAAAWLRNLISAGHIAPGDVDTRSIVDVGADDYKSYTQVHLFAGIGGWSLAARLAGWPDDKPLWTGSCPCQPFSAAGKRKGTADERHLWPEMRRLIAACRPDVVAGEQVASKDGRQWLAGVRADLEDLAYASWAADLCAAGAGTPHIRQRLWWIAEDGERLRRLADADRRERFRLADCQGRLTHWPTPRRQQGDRELERSGATGRLADTDGGLAGDGRVQRGGQHGQQPQDGGAGGLEHVASDGRIERRSEPGGRGVVGGCGDGFWSTYDVVHCTDGKARRFESFAQPLVDGLPASMGRPRTREDVFPLAVGVKNRVGRLRAYGNAIVPWVAAEVLGAYLDGEVLRLKPSGFFA